MKDVENYIRDILKSRNIKASFFLVNYNEQGKEIIRREEKHPDWEYC